MAARLPLWNPARTAANCLVRSQLSPNPALLFVGTASSKPSALFTMLKCRSAQVPNSIPDPPSPPISPSPPRLSTPPAIQPWRAAFFKSRASPRLPSSKLRGDPTSFCVPFLTPATGSLACACRLSSPPTLPAKSSPRNLPGFPLHATSGGNSPSQHFLNVSLHSVVRQLEFS